MEDSRLAKIKERFSSFCSSIGGSVGEGKGKWEVGEWEVISCRLRSPKEVVISGFSIALDSRGIEEYVTIKADGSSVKLPAFSLNFGLGLRDGDVRIVRWWRRSSEVKFVGKTSTDYLELGINKEMRAFYLANFEQF